MKVWIQGILSGIAGIIAYYAGGFDFALKIMLGAVVIDYISGLLSAWHNKAISSRIGAKGIIKKVGLFLLVAVANIVQMIVSIPIREVVIFYLIANEMISILENVGGMGIGIPPVLTDALAQIKNKNTDEKGKNND